MGLGFLTQADTDGQLYIGRNRHFHRHPSGAALWSPTMDGGSQALAVRPRRGIACSYAPRDRISSLMLDPDKARSKEEGL